MVVYFLQALLRGHSEMLKKILTPAVFSQLDGTVAASLEKDREVVHKLETLLTTMVVDESDYCAAWTQFIMRSIEHKMAPSLSSLDINVPARLRYMLSEDGGVKQEEGNAGSHSAGAGDDGQEQLGL